MTASELRPDDVFAYTVLSSAGDYEKFAVMLEGGRFRMTETSEEFQLRNPGAPVRLIRRPGDERIDAEGNWLPFGRCDTCGSPCDQDGCVSERAHAVALE